jgi:glycosyltransferase involved in cell wall biosynthesis
MKAYIAYEITDTPWGGGNQFIRALKSQLVQKNVYTDHPQDADIILFNSHQHIEEVLFLKNNFPHKKFIHRVDGPMRLYNDMSDQRDDIVYRLNHAVADATIFQTVWSRDRNLEMGMPPKNHTIIGNAANPDIFYKSEQPTPINDKIKIISTSFSNNVNKGFDTYKFIDENLNFNKYDYSFAGRSPYTFKNINSLGILNTYEIADALRSHHIYITASKKDPCSNSLIEAMTCGLPAIALNSGGHPEVLKNSGILFGNNEDLIEKINLMSSDLNCYESGVVVDSLSVIVDKYINFFKSLTYK